MASPRLPAFARLLNAMRLPRLARLGGAMRTSPRLPVLVLALAAALLAGCTTAPPQNAANLCSIFTEKRGWYKDARKSAKRWKGDIATMMAIIHQESSFKARAKPPRKRYLWVIPGPRPASAYGYAQAIDETWALYQKASGRGGADRNDFDDAIDFVGWYNNQSWRRNRIKRDDAYHLYIAYHEGHGGFEQRTHRKKQWLKDVATKVAARATTYRKQLKTCEKRLNRSWLGRLFLGG